jgi:hypothetical protein
MAKAEDANTAQLPSVTSPELRFAAAVASAAVRTAVEGWAYDEEQSGAGAQSGPAELALQNLRVLRYLPWGEIGRAAGRA